MTLPELIAALEATEGSRQLDLTIERLAVGNVPLHWRVGSQGAILGGFDDVNECIPHYTTSLDAKLPGENIVRSEIIFGGWWRATHLGKKGRHEGRAITEPLARRIAALKAMEDKE